MKLSKQLILVGKNREITLDFFKKYLDILSTIDMKFYFLFPEEKSSKCGKNGCKNSKKWLELQPLTGYDLKRKYSSSYERILNCMETFEGYDNIYYIRFMYKKFTYKDYIKVIIENKNKEKISYNEICKKLLQIVKD